MNRRGAVGTANRAARGPLRNRCRAGPPGLVRPRRVGVWLAAATIAASPFIFGQGPDPEGHAPRTSLSSALAAQPVAPEEGDNFGCLVCHLDFDGEEIVEKHLAANLTCQSCHGLSEPHRQDETLRTKPDLLWGRAEVDAMCQQCHEAHANPDAVEAFRQEWIGKTRPNGRFIREDAVCTDCHGQHTVPPQR